MMVKRETYLSQLRELKDIQIIKVIAGVRRCGKSTLLEHFKDELLLAGVPGSNIQHYNLEEPTYNGIVQRNATKWLLNL